MAIVAVCAHPAGRIHCFTKEPGSKEKFCRIHRGKKQEEVLKPLKPTKRERKGNAWTCIALTAKLKLYTSSRSVMGSLMPIALLVLWRTSLSSSSCLARCSSSTPLPARWSIGGKMKRCLLCNRYFLAKNGQVNCNDCAVLSHYCPKCCSTHEHIYTGKVEWRGQEYKRYEGECHHELLVYGEWSAVHKDSLLSELYA